MSVSIELIRDNVEPEDIALFSAYTLTATFWLLFSTLIGLLISFKFPYPDWATNPYMSFGRLRAIHTNDAFYGWASVALSGAALYVAARTSGIPIAAKRFAWFGLLCFNLAAIFGTITLDLGINNGAQEYREWVWWVTAFFFLALVSTLIALLATVATRVEREIYISNWYTIGAFIFTILLGLTAYIPVYQNGI